MSQNAQTQEIDERYVNHSVTNGDVAKYLEAENPNASVDELADRFQDWKRGGKAALDPIRADFCCPECGSADLFYTEEPDVARCDRCGLRVVEEDVSADEWVNRE